MNFDVIIHWFSLGTVGIQIVVLIGIVLVALKPKSVLVRTVGKNALGLAFVVTLVGVAGSLFLSEVAQLPVCILCWYQRVMLYPQVILLGLALWKGKDEIVDYIAAMSWVGAAIAAFHYYGQMIDTTLLPCTLTSISCSAKPFVEFGYITIPMMSLTTFAALFVLMMAHKAVRRR